jgi:hypothetical protein
MNGGIMNTMKQNILNTGKIFVLCLAIGWLTVAYGQESRKQDETVKESTMPEILSVQPTGINGEPHLRPGKQVILLGRNFSPVLARNRVSIRIVTENPRTPPPICEYAGEIHLTSASPERLEGVAPLSLESGYYLIWVRVVGAGYSKPVKVWLSSQPPPPSKPVMAVVEIASYASEN